MSAYNVSQSFPSPSAVDSSSSLLVKFDNGQYNTFGAAEDAAAAAAQVRTVPPFLLWCRSRGGPVPAAKPEVRVVPGRTFATIEQALAWTVHRVWRQYEEYEQARVGELGDNETGGPRPSRTAVEKAVMALKLVFPGRDEFMDEFASQFGHCTLPCSSPFVVVGPPSSGKSTAVQSALAATGMFSVQIPMSSADLPREQFLTSILVATAQAMVTWLSADLSGQMTVNRFPGDAEEDAEHSVGGQHARNRNIAISPTLPDKAAALKMIIRKLCKTCDIDAVACAAALVRWTVFEHPDDRTSCRKYFIDKTVAVQQRSVTIAANIVRANFQARGATEAEIASAISNLGLPGPLPEDIIHEYLGNPECSSFPVFLKEIAAFSGLRYRDILRLRQDNQLFSSDPLDNDGNAAASLHSSRRSTKRPRRGDKDDGPSLVEQLAKMVEDSHRDSPVCFRLVFDRPELIRDQDLLKKFLFLDRYLVDAADRYGAFMSKRTIQTIFITDAPAPLFAAAGAYGGSPMRVAMFPPPPEEEIRRVALDSISLEYPEAVYAQFYQRVRRDLLPHTTSITVIRDIVQKLWPVYIAPAKVPGSTILPYDDSKLWPLASRAVLGIKQSLYTGWSPAEVTGGFPGAWIVHQHSVPAKIVSRTQLAMRQAEQAGHAAALAQAASPATRTTASVFPNTPALHRFAVDTAAGVAAAEALVRQGLLRLTAPLGATRAAIVGSIENALRGKEARVTISGASKVGAAGSGGGSGLERRDPVRTRFSGAEVVAPQERGLLPYLSVSSSLDASLVREAVSRGLSREPPLEVRRWLLRSGAADALALGG
jgi:hypothetical protein